MFDGIVDMYYLKFFDSFVNVSKWPLFRKKRFEINFFVRQNASKFAIFIEKENPPSFFRFHFEQLRVFSYECPGLCDINRGIHRVKLKNALNENRKKLRRFSFSINMTNYETFCRTK